MKADIVRAPLQKGPAGEFSMLSLSLTHADGLLKNQRAAKNFLKSDRSSKADLEKWFISQKASPVTTRPPTGRNAYGRKIR